MLQKTHRRNTCIDINYHKVASVGLPNRRCVRTSEEKTFDFKRTPLTKMPIYKLTCTLQKLPCSDNLLKPSPKQNHYVLCDKNTNKISTRKEKWGWLGGGGGGGVRGGLRPILSIPTTTKTYISLDSLLIKICIYCKTPTFIAACSLVSWHKNNTQHTQDSHKTLVVCEDLCSIVNCEDLNYYCQLCGLNYCQL